jgi:alpha-L-fucosidase 2
MKHKIILYVLIALIIGKIDAQDLKLWYKQPAAKWTDAIPLGNGRIGAMVFGGLAQDRIQFNEETLWTGEPRKYSRDGAYKYLDSIRILLFADKQKEAEAMAEKSFMGLKSGEDLKKIWVEKMMKDYEPAAEKYDDSQWKTMLVPSFNGWEVVGHDGLDGAVWLRKTFDLPNNWVGKKIILDLNRIRDYDFTFVNGQLVGSKETIEPRKYTIPENILHTGKNTVSILVLNYYDKGGITGFKDTTKHIGIYPMGEEQLKISLNGSWKYNIVDDNPPPMGSYEASYQPFGDLYLNFKNTETATNYKRALDLETAISKTTYTIGKTNYTREYFVSAPNQALAVHLAANAKQSISFEIGLSSAHKKYEIAKIDDNTISLKVQVKNGALKGEAYLHLHIMGGTLENEHNKLIITNADEATLYLTAATNFINFNEVSNKVNQKHLLSIKNLDVLNYETIKKAHIKEYKKYFDRYSIDLSNKKNTNADKIATDERLKAFANANDPSFIALYQQYGRYLLISSSRPSTKPANLQGIWNDLLNPPWDSKYTTNINAEMNYWPAENLNLSALHQSLFDMIKELAIAGKQTAKDHYNMPGWVLHHNTDLWRGTAPINAANHGIWVTGGAWLCTHLWEHFLYTQDVAFLKEYYPIMKDAALFFNAFLIKDPATGYLVSSPSNSPEQGGLVAGPTMDHQIIRSLFKQVIDASVLLKTDEVLRSTLLEKYKNIAPNTIGKYGQLQEWTKDVDDTANKHRHISHLWGMHPGNEINYDETPKLMEAAKQSLLYRGDEATGWSLAWKLNCWARFKDGDHAFEMLKMLLRPVNNSAGSYVNLFDAHPPFQIDGNFGAAAGIGEMFLQSHTKFIDILPALPAAIPNGIVKGMCARGGFQFDIMWNNGALIHLKVKSNSGKLLAIRYKGKTIEIKTTKNNSYQFNGLLQKI